VNATGDGAGVGDGVGVGVGLTVGLGLAEGDAEALEDGDAEATLGAALAAGLAGAGVPELEQAATSSVRATMPASGRWIDIGQVPFAKSVLVEPEGRPSRTVATGYAACVPTAKR
jgi:hypothetical protein